MKRKRVDGNAGASPMLEGISQENPTKKLRLDGELLEEKPEVYEAKYPEIYRMVAYLSTGNPKVIAGIVKKIVEEPQNPEVKESRLELLHRWDSMLRDYKQKMQDSNGYHAIFLPHHLNMHCVQVEYDCRRLRDLALEALKFFNQASKGEDFVYHSVLIGNYTHQCGRLYRLTFRARPANSTHSDDDDVKEFEAEVAYAPWMGVRIDVGQCTVKTTRKYPLYIKQDELAEFAREAIQFFNQKPEGPHFVLHSLGIGHYTPVVGTTFPITFTAKASNDEEIKKFEAVVKRTQPWVIPSCILVRECFIIEEEKPGKAVLSKSAIVVESADEKNSTESCKIDEKTPPYRKTCINEGEERPCLISVSGMQVYAGENSKSHEELRWDSMGGPQIRNPMSFTSSTSPHEPTSRFNGNKNDLSSPLCQQYTLSPFLRSTQSSSLYTATASPPYPPEKDFAPTQVEEVDPLHESKESEEAKLLNESKESEEAKRLHELKESEEEKRLHPFLDEYNAKLKDSDGYQVLPVPECFNDRVEFYPAYGEEILKELSEEAIQYYNNENGLEFVFHSLIMASYKPSDVEKWDERAGYTTYYERLFKIAFRARPSKSNHNDEDIKEFRATVLHRRWGQNRIDNCFGLPERVYPFNTEEETLKDCAKRAVEYFNKEHKGSNLVFRSVVKGSAYSPVVGYSVFVTFKASADGNEDDIKEFEARLVLDYPWSNPYEGYVCVECELKQEEKPSKAVPSEESAVMVETADEKKSTESYKINEKTPPYSKTSINEGEERSCLISVSGMPIYAGKNNKSHEELRWDSIGEPQIGNPIPFTSFTSPHGLTFKFNGNKNNPSSPLCQQYTLSPFLRSIQSSGLYTATTSPPYPLKKDSAPAQVEEEDPLHELKESEEEKHLNELKESEEEKPLHGLKESEEVKPLHGLKESEEEKPLHELKESEEEKRLHELKESEEEKRLLPFLDDYNTKLKESDGYQVLPVPECFIDRVEFFPQYGEDFLNILCEEAIQFYNKEHGLEFVFHSLIMASYKPSDVEKMDAKLHRVNYYYERLFKIAFRAMPSKSNHNDEDIKEFRAAVLFHRRGPNRIKECFVLPKRVYLLYTAEETLKVCAETAVEYFNKVHTGSNWVFRSVVKGCAYSPVNGYCVFVTFKASADGSEDDIKEFEAKLIRDYPWSKGCEVYFCRKCELKQEAVGADQQPA